MMFKKSFNIEHLQNKKFQSSYYYILILNPKLFKSRRTIIKKLNLEGVGTSIYYPKPVPLLKYYKQKYKNKEKNFRISNIISQNSICLPIGQHLTNTDTKIILKIIKKVFSSYEK